MKVHHRSVKIKPAPAQKRELPATHEDPDTRDYRSVPPDANPGLDGFR